LSHGPGGISGASFSTESKYLVTAAASDVRVWQTDDWTSKLLCHEVEGVIAIGYSGDSQRVAITGQQALVRVFDLEPKPREIVLENDGLSRAFYSVALSGSGRWLAVGTQDNAVHVWDLDAKKRITTLHGHIQGVWNLSFSPDGRTLASSSGDSVVLWNVATWQELMSTVEPCHGLQFSPDGRYLASLSQGSRHDLRLRWAPPLAELDAEMVSPGRKDSTP
jgi:WD40 repeat protein